jgi:preprotein translocase subunit YajC
MEQYSTFFLIALMVVVFYLLIMRPQKKRQQALQRTISESVPGTRVMLGSGIFGTVVAVGDRQMVLETSPGVEITVLKQAIARVVDEGDEDTEFITDEDDVEDDLVAEETTGPEARTEPDGLTEAEPKVSDTDQKPTGAG